MELHEADLIQLKPTSASLPITPRPPQLASVPSLLNAFQNEWDATMLDLMSVKGKYLETRQELSHALYREDAAKRVIARLMRERDEAREALGALKATVGVQQQETAVAMEGVEGHASFDQVITNTFNEMSKNRKQRRVPPLPRETLAHMNLQHALPGLHSATHPGVTALDVLGDQVATGGHDKLVHVYGLDGKLIASGKGHTKKVTSVAWIIDGVIVSASADKNARLWKRRRGPCTTWNRLRRSLRRRMTRMCRTRAASSIQTV
jgi:pre-mRNA-processing factor 19